MRGLQGSSPGQSYDLDSLSKKGDKASAGPAESETGLKGAKPHSRLEVTMQRHCTLAQSLTDNPAQELETKLQEKVCAAELALFYGVNLGRLQGQIDQGGEGEDVRAAEREISVLEGIATFLESSRKKIRREGDTFHVPII